MEAAVHILFQSDYYTLCDFKCLCMECNRSKTEYNENFSICFVRTGNFFYNTFRGPLDSYTGYVLVSKPGYEYTVTHPAGIADECTIISFSNSFYEMMNEQFQLKWSGFFSNADVQSLLLKLTPGIEYLHNELLNAVSKGNCTKLEADNRVMELLEEILCSFTDHNVSKSIPARLKKDHLATVEKAKAYISNNLVQDISLESLAGHCYISPFHFSRIFKTFTGYAPYQYLLQVRLKQAEVLLKTGMPVADVAFTSGFNSIEHFSTAFKKQYQSSPSGFRALQKTQQDF